MKLKKLISFLLAVVGITAAAAAVYLSLQFKNALPILVSPPEEARNQVVSMMDAVCEGDYARASQSIYGTPELGVDREATDAVGRLFWNAFEESLSYELLGDCYTTEQGLAQDIRVTYLDLNSVTANLRDRSQAMLAQQVEEAANISDVYDENNEYREDFVMQVLLDAAKVALEKDAQEVSVELTLNLSYQDGQWWVLGDESLLHAISGGMLY